MTCLELTNEDHIIIITLLNTSRNPSNTSCLPTPGSCIIYFDAFSTQLIQLKRILSFTRLIAFSTIPNEHYSAYIK